MGGSAAMAVTAAGGGGRERRRGVGCEHSHDGKMVTGRVGEGGEKTCGDVELFSWGQRNAHDYFR